MSNFTNQPRDEKGKFIRWPDSGQRLSPQRQTCKVTGCSRDYLWKVTTIYNFGSIEIHKQLDEKKISVNQAHKIVMAERKQRKDDILSIIKSYNGAKEDISSYLLNEWNKIYPDIPIEKYLNDL